MFKIIPQKNNVVVEINCDLNKLTSYKLKKIKSALNNYGLVYFRKQKLSSKSYLNFAKKFGTPANYPRLKGLNSKYPKITVVERKHLIKAQVLVNNFIQTQVTQKNLQDLQCCYQS